MVHTEQENVGFLRTWHKNKIIPRHEIEVEETIVKERAPSQENLTHMSLKPLKDEPIASEVWVSHYQQKQNSSLWKSMQNYRGSNCRIPHNIERVSDRGGYVAG